MTQSTVNQLGSELAETDQGKPENGGHQTIAVIRKNATSDIRILICEYKDRQHLDIRIWEDRDQGEGRRPTKSGIACRLDRIPELRAALKLVLERMPPEERPELGI